MELDGVGKLNRRQLFGCFTYFALALSADTQSVSGPDTTLMDLEEWILETGRPSLNPTVYRTVRSEYVRRQSRTSGS